MSSVHYFQIMIDITFLVVVVFLLQQLNKYIKKSAHHIDNSNVYEIKKLMNDSQEYANQFIKAVEENEQRLETLFSEMDKKEKSLISRMNEAELIIKGIDKRSNGSPDPVQSDGNKYEYIIKMIKEGRSNIEIAERLGVTEGEINLVVELERARNGNS
jgi:ABC-type proline/glycine betaine transport system ATPase subunit